MKIAILSFTSGKYNRGVETTVFELSVRWGKEHKILIIDYFSPRGIQLLKKFLVWKPDIVIPLNRGWQAVWVRLFCWLTGTKMIVSGQAGYKDRWSLLTCPDVFIALTKRAAKWARKFSFGVKVKVIPNGVDLGRFKPTGARLKLNLLRPIILCVAGGERYKRVEETVRAVAQLQIGSLLLVGGNETQEKLGQKLLGARFLRKKFTHKQMPSVYRSVDVFTLVSQSSEAFGVCYLEALASGLPVVAPDDSLRREILGKYAIYVNDVNNKQEYAKKLQKASKVKKSRPKEWLKQYDWGKVAKQYEEIFKNLVEK
jgi:glycosyltransferase involved in cell wall biosynthesis